VKYHFVDSFRNFSQSKKTVVGGGDHTVGRVRRLRYLILCD